MSMREMEERYRRLIEAVSDYVFHVRVENGRAVETIHAANCDAVTGYTPDEFAANPFLWMDMVPPDDRKIVEEHVARTLSGKETQPIEHRIRKKDGRLCWVFSTTVPHKDQQGNLIAYDGLLRDITERKQYEEQLKRLNETLEQRVEERTAKLRESQVRMNAILNAAVDAVITIDRKGNIVSVNAAVERIFGYTKQELLGRNVKVLMPPPYHQEHDGYIARYLATGEKRIIGIGREVIGQRKDGSTFPVDLAVSEVADFDLFTGIVRDITERKELQRQVVQAAIEEQTRIAHDLHDGMGQELTGLSYMTQTLLDVLENPAFKEHVGLPAISKQAAILGEKIAAGLKTTQQRVRHVIKGLMPVDVDTEGLQAALEELVDHITTQRLECILECDKRIRVANTSVATHLYRIAQEAINNALKHSGADRITVSLEEGSNCLTLTVRDNGVGIPVTPGQPQGMGLQTMRYRSGLIGAKLDIQSDPNGGTVVRCVLPKQNG